MADKLPDELIKEILAPVLRIPEDMFTDMGAKSVFCRLNSQAGVCTLLLVCKRWLRVATPLLYEIVILRSKAQAQALSTVLTTSKTFGTFIRKLRVEGGYGAAMKTVLSAAPNITDIYLSLYLWSDDNVSGLCRSLPSINPRLVILFDVSNEVRDNANTRKLTKTLGECILSHWSRMEVFCSPFVLTTRAAYIDRRQILQKRDQQIVDSLVTAPKLQCLVYNEYYGSVQEFSRYLPRPNCLRRVEFKSPCTEGFMAAVNKDDKLVHLVHFLAASPTKASPGIIQANPFYAPLSTASEVARSKFGLVFSNSPWVPTSLLALPILYTYPVILKRTSFQRFCDRISEDPRLGTFVRSLFVSAGGGSPLGTEDCMTDVAPLMPNLCRFYCPRAAFFLDPPIISTRAFELLVQTAGSSLVTFRNVIVRDSELCSSYRFSTLGDFKALRFLDWSSIVTFEFRPDELSPTALASLEQLKLTTYSKSMIKLFTHLRLPCLTQVDIGSTSGLSEMPFFEKHGSKLLTLEFCSETNIPVFDLCPNLSTVRYRLRHIAPEIEQFSCNADHINLTKIIVLRSSGFCSSPLMTVTPKVHQEWTKFFQDVNLTRFPSLSEIKITDIAWPTTEREISKNPWPQWSETFQMKWNVHLTDGDGRVWTPRLKAR
ncbi:hypothetical protein JAAARDRAFT_192632 [Jaapia argillacea MUCL 33604]|uniref:Uncharacterized protein n=1 Tax=Jaapia argillacea MUCL 33604 TaxID=933084 RepID=A0A067PYV9_9AGAM|nr:hypothetical protein JAAARDRAFT_192632 [Jaapia argillacea MUCL 33604]